MSFCENCGNEVSEVAKFCSNCGEKVNQIKEQIDQVDQLKIQYSTLPISNKIKEIETYNEEDLSAYLIDKSELDFLVASKSGIDGKLKYGFINRKGEWMIHPMFDEVLSFEPPFDKLENYSTLHKDIFTKAKLDDKWGFINQQGLWVIQPVYDYCFGFHGRDISSVKLNGKDGYINRRGEWLGEGSTFTMYDKNGYRLMKETGKWGFINQKSEWIIEPKFDKLENFDKKGYASAKYGGKYGSINLRGEWIIQPIFEKSINFFDGADNTPAKFNGLYGLIDRNGNWLINPKFDNPIYFGFSEFAIGELKEKYGLINIKGEWQIDPIFDSLEGKLHNFRDNLPIVKFYLAKSAGKSGIINVNGNWLIPLQLSEFEFGSNDNFKNYWDVKLDDKWGVFLANSNWVIEPIFDDRPQGYNEIDKACVGSCKGKFGYLGSHGSWIIKPKYDSLGNFYEDVDITDFEEDGCFGLINRNGKVVVDPEFDSISIWDFKDNNFARAANSDFNWGLINKKGEWILQPDFDDIDDIDENGMAKATVGNKYGWIDKNGWVIQPMFDKVWIDLQESDHVIRRDDVSPIKLRDGAGIR